MPVCTMRRCSSSITTTTDFLARLVSLQHVQSRPLTLSVSVSLALSLFVFRLSPSSSPSRSPPLSAPLSPLCSITLQRAPC
ncbi:hypothetical protein L226DRAFT_533196 [Lentinus tigrinus ALCF2SS1-7]|uniref:uncharacterized protein n=1 Tax=Lentinus tigrinus ALCF2SS1-7 TaxID=1328758 RepID=UPI0011660763|nr:hypothetical protein L226DRAFT_533196 [Lentinus tigrinus ALCF2SS1-7]